MSNLAPSILLVDDYPVVKQGLSMVLKTEFPLATIREASSSADALALLHKEPFDLLITDINMPGRDGLELLQDIRHEKINLPVLVMSMHAEEHMAIRSFKTGAAGYLNKTSGAEELIAAVRKLLDGGKYITPGIAEKMIFDLNHKEVQKPHELLSNREYETALLLASGKTISDIAKELSLSTTTISTYRARILEKMEMKTTAELVTYFIKHSISDIPRNYQ